MKQNRINIVKIRQEDLPDLAVLYRGLVDKPGDSAAFSTAPPLRVSHRTGTDGQAGGAQ